MRRPTSSLTSRSSDLSRALGDLGWIRRRADERCAHEIATIARACEGLAEPDRDRLIAKACRPHRRVEAALARRLAERLDQRTRRAVFDRTLDPQFLPAPLERDVPAELAAVILG